MAEPDSAGSGRPPITLPQVPLFRYAAVTATVLGVLALAGVLWMMRSVVVSVFLGLFLAAGLEPLVHRLERFGLRRGFAVAIVVIGLVTVVILFLLLTLRPAVSEIVQLAENAPAMLEKLSSEDNPVGRFLDRPDVQHAVQTFVDKLPGYLASSAGRVVGTVGAALSGLVQAMTIFILMIYFMLAWPRIVSRAERLLARPERVEVAREAISRIGGYVTGQLTVSILAGVSAYVFMKIAGVPYAAVLALVVGFCDLIPQIGATIGAVVCTLVALTDSAGLAIVTAAFVLLYQQVENYLIAPRVFARSVKLSPVTVFIAALAGVSIGGFVGAIIALPCAAALKVIIRYLMRRQLSALEKDLVS